MVASAQMGGGRCKPADLSTASRYGRLREALVRYVRPHAIVGDEVGYLAYGPDAANILYHVVNERHVRAPAMVLHHE